MRVLPQPQYQQVQFGIGWPGRKKKKSVLVKADEKRRRAHELDPSRPEDELIRDFIRTNADEAAGAVKKSRKAKRGGRIAQGFGLVGRGFSGLKNGAKNLGLWYLNLHKNMGLVLMPRFAKRFLAHNNVINIDEEALNKMGPMSRAMVVSSGSDSFWKRARTKLAAALMLLAVNTQLCPEFNIPGILWTEMTPDNAIGKVYKTFGVPFTDLPSPVRKLHPVAHLVESDTDECIAQGIHPWLRIKWYCLESDGEIRRYVPVLPGAMGDLVGDFLEAKLGSGWTKDGVVKTVAANSTFQEAELVKDPDKYTWDVVSLYTDIKNLFGLDLPIGRIYLNHPDMAEDYEQQELIEKILADGNLLGALGALTIDPDELETRLNRGTN